jgi:hypothetical protein
MTGSIGLKPLRATEFVASSFIQPMIETELILGAYLASANSRRVRPALAAIFGRAVGKDTVSRVSRKVKADWVRATKS